MDLLDFELEVTPAADGGFTVTVLRSPAGEATGTMRRPFDSLALENRLQALQIALLKSASVRRGGVASPEAATVQRFGQELWDALFTGDILTAFEVSRSEARQQDAGIRVKLRFVAPELAALPWEYLYDPHRGDYLTLSMTTPLVRYIPLPQSIEPLSVTPPLRILAMIASPNDLPALDVDRERQRLEQATASLRQKGLIELSWLPGQTWRDLSQALRQGPWHIFHFIGHGAFDPTRAEGLVVFESEKGGSERFSSTDLGRLLGDHAPLRLAVLNSCESARGDQADIFSSTAATLVRAGTPAVVAMQYEITDEAAIEFSRSFYDAIADGMPVDSALSEARKGIAFAIPGTLEWGTPVLFMRSPDGKLFDLPAPGQIGLAPDAPPAPAGGADGVVAAAAGAALVAAASMPAVTPPTPPSAAVFVPALGSPPPSVPASADPRGTMPAGPGGPEPAAVQGSGNGSGRRWALAGVLLVGGFVAILLAFLAVSGSFGGGSTETSPPVAAVGGAGTTAEPASSSDLGAASASAGPGATQGLTGTTSGETAAPTDAGRTGRIIFSNDAHGIVIAEPDGSSTLVPGTSTTDSDPFWSPDGSMVVFNSSDGIRISTVDGTDTRQFSDGGTSDAGPVWSSTGEIAFASRREGRYQLYVGPADGSAPPAIFRRSADVESDPAWSPDGSQLAFVRTHGGNDDIAVVASDGSGFHSLTSGAGRDVDPAWSPDGSRIVFASDRDHQGDFDLWTMNADGTGQSELTSGSAVDHDPTWSPDGRFIAFSRSGGGQATAEIVILDMSTGTETTVTNGDGDSKFPSWR